MPRAIQPQPNRRIAIPTRRQVAGRLVLYLLTLIHLVLPWTLVNQNDSTTVLVGGMIIGIGFLVLALWSRRNPVSAFGIGAVFFLIVETVAAATGASPWSEGWPVKLALGGVFVWALLALWVPQSKQTEAVWLRLCASVPSTTMTLSPPS